MEKNEVKKELLKSKVNANFSHYIAGNLYYKVTLSTGTYQFPIATIEKHSDEGHLIVNLSSDLGTTRFESEIKGSYLGRWIDKAIEKEEFIQTNK